MGDGAGGTPSLQLSHAFFYAKRTHFFRVNIGFLEKTNAKRSHEVASTGEAGLTGPTESE
jgi:hypothetical protein